MNKSSFCCLPWIHLATHPHGNVSLCCESDHTNGKNMARQLDDVNGDKMLSLNHDSIPSIMNSDYFKQVRLQMLNGEKPKACQNCFKVEANGGKSKRVIENQNYNHFTYDKARSLTEDDGSIPVALEFVELRLGNLCNVKCRSCNPFSSTKWLGDYKALSEELSFVDTLDPDLDFSWPDSDRFWQDLSKSSPSLKTFYINGGEPTLSKKHWTLLETLIEKGQASKIHLDYSINMTHLPEMAFKIWNEFKSVNLRASIDDLKDRNFYLRHPTQWKQVEETLEKIKKNSKNVSLVVLQTVSAMNFYYLDEFYLWAKGQNIEVVHNFVTEPHYLSPKVIPLEARQEILKRLKKTLPSYQFKVLNSLFSSEVDEEGWQQFQLYTKSLDKIRNESFSSTFAEFYDNLHSRGWLDLG